MRSVLDSNDNHLDMLVSKSDFACMTPVRALYGLQLFAWLSGVRVYRVLTTN
jgi:hypothetical protein